MRWAMNVDIQSIKEFNKTALRQALIPLLFVVCFIFSMLVW